VTVFTARIEANGPERRELMQALLTWATVARHEVGGLRVHVYEDLESPGAFHLASQWSSPGVMERHLSGPDFGILLGALELLARPPRVMVTEVADEGEQEAFQRIWRLRDRARRAGHPDPFRDVS
jgi:quinol monooxygenase YgiN